MTAPNEGKSRWWRRGRDQAQADAATQHGLAASALWSLDQAQANLGDLVSAYQDLAAHRPHADAAYLRLIEDWQAVSTVCGTAIDLFQFANSTYDPSADPEEAAARATADAFARAVPALEDAAQQCSRFRQQYDKDLTQAALVVKAAPAAFEKALVALTSASQALRVAQEAGYDDPDLAASLREATDQAGVSEQALSQRRWADATTHADAARVRADQVAARATALPEQAQEVRRSIVSLRTRADILHGRADRLASTMSELRRKYRQAAWDAVADAPTTFEASMNAVTDGLHRLEKAADPASGVMDVAAASLLLRQTRAVASEADTAFKAAVDALDRLNRVAQNPQDLMTHLRDVARDARRFVNNLPERLFTKYAPTYDSYARRIDELDKIVNGQRPDWALVVVENEQVLDGLDRLVRTARSEL